MFHPGVHRSFLNLPSVVPTAGAGGSSRKSGFGLSTPCSLGVPGSVNATCPPKANSFVNTSKNGYR